MTASHPNAFANTTFIAVELDSSGLPSKVAMTFQEKTIMVSAENHAGAEIPKSWRQDLSAWDGEMELAHPYQAGSLQDRAIRRLAEAREIAGKRILSIEDVAPDPETRIAIQQALVSQPGNSDVEAVAKAFQRAAHEVPF